MFACVRRIAPIALGCCLCLAPQTKWRLTWSDDFNGASGSDVDSSKWSRDLGASGWGNHELETYTNSLENAHLDGDGHLLIRVVRTPAGYASARLKTLGKYSVTYGKIEARIRIPYGQGIWPAFWMMGDDVNRGWPRCGEIDIVENIGREPSIVHGTAHGPGYSGSGGITGQYAMPNGQRLSDGFHVYSIEWEPDLIRWYIDSRLYHTVSRANIPVGSRWVFDHPFFILLNVAVGGDWPGSPDPTTQFPQEMVVDYVRVWAAAT